MFILLILTCVCKITYYLHILKCNNSRILIRLDKKDLQIKKRKSPPMLWKRNFGSWGLQILLIVLQILKWSHPMVNWLGTIRSDEDSDVATLILQTSTWQAHVWPGHKVIVWNTAAFVESPLNNIFASNHINHSQLSLDVLPDRTNILYSDKCHLSDLFYLLKPGCKWDVLAWTNHILVILNFITYLVYLETHWCIGFFLHFPAFC